MIKGLGRLKWMRLPRRLLSDFGALDEQLQYGRKVG